MAHFDLAAIARDAAHRHGVLALDELAAHGMTARQAQRRCESGQFQRAHRGVYAVGHLPQTPMARWRAAVLAAGPGAALSHLSAARLHRLVRWEPRRTDVSAERRARNVTGVRIHRTALAPNEIVVVEAITVTSVSRTIADCAQLLPVDGVVALMREARHLGTFDRAELERYCDPRPRRHGAPCLRTALERHGNGGVGYRSGLEEEVRTVVVTRGAPEPLVNVPFPTDRGLVEVDLAWPELRLCLAVDGPTHDDDEQRTIDLLDEHALRRGGWDVRRVHWRDFRADRVASTDEIMSALASAMARAATSPIVGV